MSKLNFTSINSSDVPKSSLEYNSYMDITTPSSGYGAITSNLNAPTQYNPNSSQSVGIPESLPNGGLYNAPQSREPWANIPVVPTETNLIHYNLRSAHPPPGATEQYISTLRVGNNYTDMQGVYWYNPDNVRGFYYMQTTKKEDMKQY